MHPVADLIHRRLRGEQDDAKLAVVAEESGMKWVIIAGMASRLEAHQIVPEIIGGTSGGGGAMMFYSQQRTQIGTLALTHLSSAGYGNTGKRFINPWRLLVGRPIMDVEGLIDNVFTHLTPLLWDEYAKAKLEIFLTITNEHGEAVIQPVHGLSAAEAKETTKATCRIPFIAGSLRRYRQWDGALATPLPIEPALVRGATHVLALRCATAKPHFVEPYLLWPLLRWLKPKLYRAAKTRNSHKQRTAEQYRKHPHILFAELPQITIHSGETNELKLMQHALQGWEIIGTLLHLPPVPYPALWRPTMERLGLANGAEFA